MSYADEVKNLFTQYIAEGDAAASQYFSLIKELVARRNTSGDPAWQKGIEQVYTLVHDEICNNKSAPREQITFGTSGWRGQLGKDVFVRSVACVTRAIAEMYNQADGDQELLGYLGVSSCSDAKKQGCVIGHDNRFAGNLLSAVVAKVLTDEGFSVHYAGESTTGVLSAAVLEMGCAFSINLTPSHNPLEYGGYKFNAADAGPAAAQVTGTITRLARKFIEEGYSFEASAVQGIDPITLPGVSAFDSLATWKNLVRKNGDVHGLYLDDIIQRFLENKDMVVVVDSVHGASRLHITSLIDNVIDNRLVTLRDTEDVTFGGIAPEPSSVNMRNVMAVLRQRKEALKLGAIIDPDGDRIRFTDGSAEISMNQFGAMAYHFLKVYKKKDGMVAKTVATSNMANSLAEAFGEELFEPRVGFKEFKPVIGRALVFFEESDGISIIGHTPEKDAYIGLLLALDMVLTTGKNLGDYLDDIEKEFGAYYPDRDGITVSLKGEQLLKKLDELQQYGVGSELEVGGVMKKITRVITIDGRKMILEDGSWVMIRPSGTEPKVRFYVESRTKSGTADLVATAKGLLQHIGVV
jgi:phosphomannomutase